MDTAHSTRTRARVPLLRDLSVAPPPVATAQKPDRRLYVHDGHTFHEAPAEEIIGYAQQLIAEQLHRGSRMLAREEIKDILRLRLALRRRETFVGLFFDRFHRLIDYVELFEGTVDHVCIHPREVIREVLAHNTVSAIFARSDPSGCAEPAALDHVQYARLRYALALIDIRVLDYFVVGATVTSLAERERSRSIVGRNAVELLKTQSFLE
jgi:DNA repair protein RadC